ncbi:MAG: hypothetical protein HYX67_03790 [Candidatus Melainabacteria bacterium]|nr:hypothetical protein [Candidatus Melainabacteria bacterium]
MQRDRIKVFDVVSGAKNILLKILDKLMCATICIEAFYTWMSLLIFLNFEFHIKILREIDTTKQQRQNNCCQHYATKTL